MEKMKILVVGCGSIGLRHLQCLLARDDCRCMACDSDPGAEERVKKIHPEIPCFSDYRKALAANPELVIVCTPNELHERFSIEAFENGAHVLCEKPIAHNLESGKRIMEAAERLNRVLAVGYTERFRPAFQYILKKTASGGMGTLIGGRAMVGTYNTLLCAKSNFRDHSFGVLLIDYTHELDMLHAIFGRTADVVCKANSLARDIRPAPSLAAMLLEYHSGAIVSVHFDYVQHPQRRIMEIYGDRQTLVYDLQANTVAVFDRTRPEPEVHSFPCERNALFMAEHENIIRAIHSGTPVMVNGRQALDSLEIAEQAINSL